MIVLSNSDSLTIRPGETVNFDSVRLHTGNGEFHRRGFPAVKLRCKGIYEVNFSGNVAASEKSPIQLAVALDGIPLPESVMISTPSTNCAFNNISTVFPVQNCCSCTPISVVNNGDMPVVLAANSVFYISRRA